MSDRATALVDVLLIEDDPGDALMARETFELANKNCRFHVVPTGRPGCGSSARPASTPAHPCPA